MGSPIDNCSDNHYSEHMISIDTKALPVGARHLDGSECGAPEACTRTLVWEGGLPAELPAAETRTFRHHAGHLMDTVQSDDHFYSPTHGLTQDVDGWARLGWTLTE